MSVEAQDGTVVKKVANTNVAQTVDGVIISTVTSANDYARDMAIESNEGIIFNKGANVSHDDAIVDLSGGEQPGVTVIDSETTIESNDIDVAELLGD
jgi:hypothetical protein